MRNLALVAGLLVLTGVPAPARACSGYCGNERFYLLYPETTSPVPRDGAVVVYGGAGGETCREELASHVGFEVRHGGDVVPGTLDIPGGTGLFVFVPHDPWLPDAKYTATLTIDNTGIAPPVDHWCAITEDILSESFEFTTSVDAGPPLPTLPAPVFTTRTWPIDDRLDSIVCCPGSAPESDDSAGCDYVIEWFAPDVCAYLFEETVLEVGVGAWTPPAALAGQVLYELFLDGELAARGIDLEVFGALRSTATCASLRATHLGTRARVDSPTVCAPAEQAALLGIHARDVTAELACADPVLCGATGSEWNPGACVPFDPQDPPTPPAAPVRDGLLDTPCPGLLGPGKPAAGGSGEPKPAGADSGDEEDLADREGCGCNETPSPGLFALTLLAVGLRRRRTR